METTFDLEEHIFADRGGWCPNSKLPLLIYRGVLDDEGEAAAEKFEAAFAANGWPPAWRYTIYDYAHYHSTAHETIGVYRGRATVRFGDTAGLEVELRAGDVVVIPAGVSHQLIESVNRFHGVGAYPEGAEVDEQRAGHSDRPAADERIARLRRPDRDPWLGARGPLLERWPAEADGIST